ncbi:MAG: 2-amino-4-hydroxy-6-hydroxymethyldihydropteridine diphosphokinase [Thermodesulfobacteriota bacterium]
MDGPGAGGGAVSGVVAYIGVGSNMGNPAAACREAMARLAEWPGIRLLRASSLYRTEPVGLREQAWFVNAAVEIRTGLSPMDLFSALKQIERRMGRFAGERWGPRVIDLDLLLYGQEVLGEQGLVIPHPELHRRRFVLVPLCELASYAIHPAFGVSVRGLLDRLADPARVEICVPACAEIGTP